MPESFTRPPWTVWKEWLILKGAQAGGNKSCCPLTRWIAFWPFWASIRLPLLCRRYCFLRCPVGRVCKGRSRLSYFFFATFKLVEFNGDRRPWLHLRCECGSPDDDLGTTDIIEPLQTGVTGEENAAWPQHCISVKDPPIVVGIEADWGEILPLQGCNWTRKKNKGNHEYSGVNQQGRLLVDLEFLLRRLVLQSDKYPDDDCRGSIKIMT